MKKEKTKAEKIVGCGCGTILWVIFGFIIYSCETMEDVKSFFGEIISPLYDHDTQRWAFIGDIMTAELPDNIAKTMPQYMPMTSDYYNEKLYNNEENFVKSHSIDKNNSHFAGVFFATRRCIAMSFSGEKEKDLKTKLLALNQQELETFKALEKSKVVSNQFALMAKAFFNQKNNELAKTYFNCWGLWNMSPQEYIGGRIPTDVFSDMGKEASALFLQ